MNKDTFGALKEALGRWQTQIEKNGSKWDKIEVGYILKETIALLDKAYPEDYWHPTEPTTILSKAIEQVEQRGNYKVMVALVDLDKTKPKEERLYTFTDIESKKLREVIYKEMEKDV